MDFPLVVPCLGQMCPPWIPVRIHGSIGTNGIYVYCTYIIVDGFVYGKCRYVKLYRNLNIYIYMICIYHTWILWGIVELHTTLAYPGNISMIFVFLRCLSI